MYVPVRRLCRSFPKKRRGKGLGVQEMRITLTAWDMDTRWALMCFVRDKKKARRANTSEMCFPYNCIHEAFGQNEQPRWLQHQELSRNIKPTSKTNAVLYHRDFFCKQTEEKPLLFFFKLVLTSENWKVDLSNLNKCTGKNISFKPSTTFRSLTQYTDLLETPYSRGHKQRLSDHQNMSSTVTTGRRFHTPLRVTSSHLVI